jgi:hypothetical protein
MNPIRLFIIFVIIVFIVTFIRKCSGMKVNEGPEYNLRLNASNEMFCAWKCRQYQLSWGCNSSVSRFTKESIMDYNNASISMYMKGLCACDLYTCE